MAPFYHVDRASALSEAQIINLVRFTDITPAELQSHIDHMFPEGVSRHGDTYFLSNKSHPNLASPNIELLFEYVRRAFYPGRPSRFQSFFAFSTLDAALAFRDKYCGGIGKVREVSASRSFAADMALLTQGTTLLLYSYLAHLYWLGRSGEDPIWEILLTPPITVLGEVA